MSSIQNIDFSLYSNYAFTKMKQPFKTEIRIDSGYVDFTGCDLFDINDGTIICFKNQSYEGFHDIKITGDEVDYIQTVNQNILKRVIEEREDDYYIFYVFLDSTVQNSKFLFDESFNIKIPNLPSDFIKCDYQKLGGTPFYPGRTGYDVTNVFYALSITGIGHVLRVETVNEGNKNQGIQAEYAASKTLTGMIKLLQDWAILRKEPFNNQEKISQSATEFLQNLNLGENVELDISDVEGDTHLARFIKGDIERSADQEVKSRFPMPESFKNYLKHHYTYQSLYDLNKNLNLNIFDDALIIKYKNYFEKILFNYCNKNGIDLDSMNSIQDLYNLESTKGYIKDIISQYVQLDD